MNGDRNNEKRWLSFFFFVLFLSFFFKFFSGEEGGGGEEDHFLILQTRHCIPHFPLPPPPKLSDFGHLEYLDIVNTLITNHMTENTE